MKQRGMSSMDRRRFLTVVSGGLAAGAALAAVAARGAGAAGRFQAVALDAFTVFDPRPIAALAETIFPGKGAVLSDAWRGRPRLMGAWDDLKAWPDAPGALRDAAPDAIGRDLQDLVVHVRGAL